MIYDSASFILGKSLIYERGNLQEIVGIVPARPLHMLSIYLNFLIAGMEPAYFRLFNLAILAAAGTALAFLALLVFEAAGGPGGSCGDRKAVSVFLGVLFVVHPIQSLVVLYIWQREAILACFFVFSGVALYIAVRSGRVRRPLPGYAGVAGLCLAGLMCKENVMALPAVLLLAEVTLFRAPSRAALKKGLLISVVAVPLLLAYALVVNSLQAPESATPEGTIGRLVQYYDWAGLTPLHVGLTECRVLFQYLGSLAAPWLVGTELIRVQSVSLSLWDPSSTALAVCGVLALLVVGVGIRKRYPVAAFGILFFLGALVPESCFIPHYLFFGYRPILPMAGLLLALGDGLLRFLPLVKERAPAECFRLVAGGMAFVIMAPLCHLTFSTAKNWGPLNFWSQAFSSLPPANERTEIAPYLNVIVSYAKVLGASGDHVGSLRALDEFRRLSLAVGPPQAQRTEGDPAKGATENGSPVFERMVRSFPRPTAACLSVLATSLRETGNLPEAIMTHRKAITIDPEFGPPYESFAVTLEKSGDLEAAIDQLKKAIELEPESFSGQALFGAVLERLGKHDEAAQHFAEAVQLDPKSVEAKYHLATSLLKTGKTAEEVLSILAELSAGKARSYSRTTESTADAPNTVTISGARDVFDRIMKADAQGAATLLVIVGRVLHDNERKSEALGFYRRAVVHDPGSGLAHENLGNALEKSGDLVGAIEQFRLLVRIDPKSLHGRTKLGLALDRSGAKTEAMNCFVRAVELQPNSPEANFNVANSLLKAGRAAESIPFFKKALAAKPDFTDAEANLGAALVATGQFARATRRLKKAAAAKTDNAELYNLLGVAYAQLQRTTDAACYFQRALEIDPKHEGARLNLDRFRK
jgi:tetratricopeptide (TPR) repeat protein